MWRKPQPIGHENSTSGLGVLRTENCAFADANALENGPGRVPKSRSLTRPEDWRPNREDSSHSFDQKTDRVWVGPN